MFDASNVFIIFVVVRQSISIVFVVLNLVPVPPFSPVGCYACGPNPNKTLQTLQTPNIIIIIITMKKTYRVLPHRIDYAPSACTSIYIHNMIDKNIK